MGNAIFQYLSELSLHYGTGDTASDLVGVTLVVSFMALMIGLVSYRRERSIDTVLPSMERIQGMNGKLEKIERTMNELRTEMLRQIELTKGSLEFTKEELVQIRDSLNELIGRGTAGGGGSTPSSSSPGGSFGAGAPSTGSGGMSGRAAASTEKPFDTTTTEITAQEVKTFFNDLENEEQLEKKSEHIPSAPTEENTGVFSRMKRSRESLVGKIKGFFSNKTVLDQSMVDQLEEILVSSDVGVKTSMVIIESLQSELGRGEQINEAVLLDKVKNQLLRTLLGSEGDIAPIVPVAAPDGPFVVVLVGVNGAGKTTTVAKLAHQWREEGKSVMVAAADTFRAAAVEQLKEWADRIQVPVISGAEGAKPATVVYDAMVAAKRDGVDVLIVDTAGRLQNKTNLMQELEGIRNVMSKHQASAPHEVLLVIDGASGQNALSQAREFNAAVKLTGLVITKLDGTPKGGMVVAIKSELGVPVRYIGVGEKREDLRPFIAQEFVDALLGGAAQGTSEYSFSRALGKPFDSSSTSLH